MAFSNRGVMQLLKDAETGPALGPPRKVTDAHQPPERVFGNAFCVSLPILIIFKLDALNPLQLGIVGGLVVGSLRGTLSNISHFNARLHLGWATVLWIGPQLHRIHHSRLIQHLRRLSNND
jgi:sterol desaturase/sphingolipid hydroxylase (fatty acid hydroxylase superfamily)